MEKEIMPYQLYTQDNIEKVYVPIVGAVSYLNDDVVQQFINNIDRWECRGDGHKFNEFNKLKYLSKYCEMDCQVLRLGYATFRGWMLEYTGLDVDNCTTIQSLSSDYK
ncbi:MAG: hypothetical protein NXI30_29050, partial [bacterium]|nr:hypothetical protein [bacterium]